MFLPLERVQPSTTPDRRFIKQESPESSECQREGGERMHLLEIVETEREVAHLLEQAQAQKESKIATAMIERERKLANLKPPKETAVSVPRPKQDLTTIKKAATKNKKKAVQKILEEVYAAA